MPLGAQITGNPFSHAPSGLRNMGAVDLATGTFMISDVDLRLPSTGFEVVVGRSYSCVQHDGTSHHDSAGLQGNNWHQSSMPELIFYDGDANKETTDIVYLVYGADAFAEYKRVATDADIFRGINGAAGVIEHVENETDEPDTYRLNDIHGNEFWFFGDDGDAGSAEGLLWKIRDTASTAKRRGMYPEGGAEECDCVTKVRGRVADSGEPKIEPFGYIRLN